MKKYALALLLPILLFMMGCQNENIFEEQTDNNHGVCKLVMNATLDTFDGQATRVGSSTWNNGDCVYLSFQANGNKVKGRAIYDESNDDWTLYYDGILANGTYSGKATYIEGVSENTNKIALSYRNSVYTDGNIFCEKTSEMMKITAVLKPQTGRIRFLGTPGREFEVTGVWCYKAIETSDCQLSLDDTEQIIRINDDGYSDYVYCGFPQLSRNLSISYDNYVYSTVCEHPILDAAQSGYMELPTEAKHNGWNMTVITLPTLSKVTTTCVENQGTVSFSAEVLSAGNGNLRECGFVYSKNENPTISDGKVACEDKEKLSATINGLTIGDGYYVRAYAINQIGTAYSEQVSFIAGGGRPQDGDIDRPILVKKR